MVVAVLLTAGVVAHSYFKSSAVQLEIQSSIQKNLMLSELAGDIRYYDEVLTMSTQLAVYSNDPMGLWQERHKMSGHMLADALRRATLDSTEAVIDDIDKMNKKLLSIENLVFASINAGAVDKAKALISSSHYQGLKQQYNQLSYNLHERLSASVLSNRTSIRQAQRQSKFFTFLMAGLISLMWVSVLGRAARDRREILTSTTELTELAHYDHLTGLANRALFNQRLEEAADNSNRTGLSMALIVIDVDRFKEINDCYGHMAGDALLKSISDKLQGRARVSDTVARLGGDEFAIVATNIAETALIHNLVGSIIEEGAKSIVFENNTFGTTQSIGIALYPDDADNVQNLMQKADFALYQAKQSGRGNYRLFDYQLEEKVQQRKRMQDDIIIGLREQQFSVHFQPLIDIHSEKLVSVECLLRWNHPEHGSISPADFVPVAEECGLIIDLGNWVLEQACAQQVRWRTMGLGDIIVAVNLSSVQFQNPDLVPSIKHTVMHAGMSPGKLELEITESGIMDKGESVVELLQELNEFGLKLAIDDFGTGYSSLSYLKHFPVQNLKIDREFITDLPHNNDDAAIARTIISMGHALNLKVIAEGVETEEQLQFLKEENCDVVQGYLFSRPVCATEFEQWYKTKYLQDSKVVSFKAS